jgi:hypothetical protein
MVAGVSAHLGAFCNFSESGYKDQLMKAVRSGTRWWQVPVLLALLVASAGEVRAETDKREIEARADFVAGRYQAALDIYAQLYAETLNPIFIRNVARCQQNLRRPQAAIDAFQDYLRKAKGLKADERQEVQGYIKEMQALLATQTPATPPAATAPPPATTAPPPAQAPPAAAPPPAAAAAPPGSPPAQASPPGEQTAPSVTVPPAAFPPPPAAPPPGPASFPGGPAGMVSTTPSVPAEHPWRVAGIVASVVGGAVLGTGLAFGIVARNNASAVSQQYDSSKADVGKTAQTIGFVADAVGVAAIAAGFILVIHERPGSPAMVSLSAAPGTDARSGLLLLGGRF